MARVVDIITSYDAAVIGIVTYMLGDLSGNTILKNLGFAFTFSSMVYVVGLKKVIERRIKVSKEKITG